MANEWIDDTAALEARLGKPPSAMHLKVIDHLDTTALQWLAASPLMFACFGSASGIDISLAGGEPGFISATDSSRMRVPKRFLDDPSLGIKGQRFGSLCLIPAIGESLRINGRVAAVDQEAIEVSVEECYVHCAKALIRSNFWGASPSAAVPSDPVDFLSASQFVALASMDAEGRADVSPKGDPAGTMVRLSDTEVCFADRPGNRRADSFRNILTQPRVAAAVLIPGSARIALIHGEAQITKDVHLLGSFAVHDKIPLLATRSEYPNIVLIESPALDRARLWPASRGDHTVDPAATLVAHVRLNKERGLMATLVRTAVSFPSLMQKGLDRDYKANLY